MRNIFRLLVGFVLIVTLAVVGSAPAAAVGTVTITHANMQNWAFEGPDEAGSGSGAAISSGGFVSGPSGAGSLGAGSAHFTLGSLTGGMFLGTPQFKGTALSTLTTLTFETYTTTPGNKDVALDFDIDYNPSAACSTLTARADCYQGRFVFVPAFTPGAIQTNTWQTWNALDPNAKNWYSSRPPIGATICAQTAGGGNTGPCSMTDLLAAYPNAAIMLRSGPGQFGIKAGSGYSTFDGNADNIVIGISGANTTFDFESGGLAATLNVNPNGEDSVCNGSANVAVSPAVAPNCAFKTINGALAQAVAGDTIAVHAGTYAEQVNVTQNLTFTGDGAGTTKIQVPAAPVSNVPSPNGAGHGYSLVALSNSATVTMSGLTLNGPWPFPGDCAADFFGVTAYGGSTLNLSNATVSNIINSDPNAYGCQQGDAIRVGRTSISETGHASISNAIVTGYQKTGILVDAVGSTGTIDHNIVTGPGPNTPLSNIIAMNGIQISRGAAATVTNNNITNNVCDASGGGCGPDPLAVQSCGILIFNADGLTIQGNTLSGNDIGIYNFSSSTAGNTISKASNGGKSKTSPSDPGPRKSIVASPTPSLISGNTVQNNRYENIFLDEGTATVNGNTVIGSNIGVEVASFNPNTEGTDGNSQGTLSKNEIKNALVAGIQLQLETGATFITKINGDSNSIHDNAAGVKNTTATVITLTNNFWGSANGPTNPTNTFNVGSQGNSVSANVNFVPWLKDIIGAPGTFTGTSFAPVTTDTPAGQFASIQAGITAATGGNVTAAAGTFSESPNVTKPVTLKSASGRDNTTIALQSQPTYLGSLTIAASNVTVDGFTIKGFDGTGAASGTTNVYVSSTLSNVTIKNNRLLVGAANPDPNTCSCTVDQGFGILTTYTETPAELVNSVTVTGNIFSPANAQGTRAFYINPGVDVFTFQTNQITGTFAGTALTQAKSATISGNTVTGTGAAGSRSGGIGTWGAPNPTIWGHATIRNNTISGVRNGIVVLSANNVTITGNTFAQVGNGVNIDVGDPSDPVSDPTTITIQTNKFNAVDTKAIQNALTSGGAANATPNWFNSQTGPTNAANVGGTGGVVSGNVTFTPWCGDAACTTFFGIPTKVVFTTQPGNATALSPFGTQPVVKAEDAAGNLGINFTGQVTLGIGTNPSGGILSGNQVNAVAGIATFTNAAIDKPGASYSLTAAATSLTGATSTAFTVAPPLPTISAVAPANGGTAGSEVVTITGTNFVTGDTVTFGGTAGTNVTVNSSTKITVTTPAHAAGKVDVRVANANAQGNTLTNGYEYDAPGAAPSNTGRQGGVGNVKDGTPAAAPTGRGPGAIPNPHP